eukprot:6462373-Amphidinium_carterae.1
MSSFRDGTVTSPKTVADTWRWPERYLASLPRCGQEHIHDLLAKRPLWCSTAFSGIGMWETGLAYLAQGVGSRGRIAVFDAADNCDAALHILLRHTGDSESQHVFGDIQERWSPQTRLQVLDVMERCCLEFGLDGCQADAALANQLAVSSRMCEVMAKAEIRETGYCNCHRQHCKYHNITLENIRKHKGLVLHMASPVCKDWSIANRGRKGLLGPHGL